MEFKKAFLGTGYMVCHISPNNRTRRQFLGSTKLVVRLKDLKGLFKLKLSYPDSVKTYGPGTAAAGWATHSPPWDPPTGWICHIPVPAAKKPQGGPVQALQEQMSL